MRTYIYEPWRRLRASVSVTKRSSKVIPAPVLEAGEGAGSQHLNRTNPISTHPGDQRNRKRRKNKNPTAQKIPSTFRKLHSHLPQESRYYIHNRKKLLTVTNESSIARPYSCRPPSVQKANQKAANIDPYPAPTATCAQVWCPSHTLDITTSSVHGNAASGTNNLRCFSETNRRVSCSGRWRHAAQINVA